MTANQDRRRTGTITAPQMMTAEIELENGVHATLVYEKGADVLPMINRLEHEHRTRLKRRGRAKKVAATGITFKLPDNVTVVKK